MGNLINDDLVNEKKIYRENIARYLSDMKMLLNFWTTVGGRVLLMDNIFRTFAKLQGIQLCRTDEGNYTRWNFKRPAEWGCENGVGYFEVVATNSDLFKSANEWVKGITSTLETVERYLVLPHWQEPFPEEERLSLVWHYDHAQKPLARFVDGEWKFTERLGTAEDWRNEILVKMFNNMDDYHFDLNAVTNTGGYIPEPAPKPKTYLTTHNPYMSKDWKDEIRRKLQEELNVPVYVDTDVASMYPAYYVPARGSAKMHPIIKELLNSMYGKPKTPLDGIKRRIHEDALDGMHYAAEAARAYADEVAEERKYKDYYYMIPPRAGKSAALGVIKLGERELEYCMEDVKETARLYNAFKEKEEDTYDWMAHTVKDIFDDMGTILHRRQIAEKDFKSKEWVWEISSDIWERLKEKPEFIGHCYSTSLPATIYCIDVRVTKLKTNYIKLVRKVKEEEDMGLYNALWSGKGHAFIMVDGRKYPINVETIDIRNGEPMKLTAYVHETPDVYMDRKPRKTQNRMSWYTPEIDQVIFNDPATIVYWKDGTKTVVQARDEAFDPEKGLAMAISKKAMGNTRDYYIPFKKWLKKFKKEHPDTVKLYTDDQVVAEFPVDRKDD